jgi:hypothetical protein
MPQLDPQLATALKQAKTVPQCFAFVAKGASEGKLLLARKSVPAREVADARKALGGGLIFRGRCGGDDGKLVFEVPKEPPSTLANQLRALIRREAGLTLPVEVRAASDLADEEAAADSGPTPGVPAAESAPPAAPAPDPAVRAALLKRLSALVGPFKEAVAGKSPHIARLHTLFPEVKRLLDQQDVPGATRSLDELEALLIQAAPAAVQPPTDRKAQALKRLNALAAAIKTALTGPEAARVKTLVGTANGLLKNNDFEKAGAVLDELEPLLAARSAPTAGTSPASPPSGESSVSLIVLQQSRLAWEAARKKAQGDMTRLQKAILEDFKGEPEFPYVQKAIARLERALEGFDDRLSDCLNEALNSPDPATREDLHREAVELLREYQQELAGSPQLAELDGNPFVPVSIHKTLSLALTVLESKLRT